MNREEYYKKESIIISKKILKSSLVKKIKRYSNKYEVPYELLCAIALIESSKRPSAIRLFEKILFALFKFIRILDVNFTLGVFQVKYSLKQQQHYWITEDKIIDDGVKLIKNLLQNSHSLVFFGKCYNGSATYGQVLDNVYKRLLQHGLSK